MKASYAQLQCKDGVMLLVFKGAPGVLPRTASDSAVVMFTRLAPRRDARQAAHRGGSTGSSVVGVYAQRLGKPQDVRTLKAGEH